jgi:hypothetical protein
MIKVIRKWWKELGVTALLTLLFELIGRGALKLVDNAIVGWIDNAIGDAFGWAAPSVHTMIDVVILYGPPLLVAVLVMVGYHLIVRPKKAEMLPAIPAPVDMDEMLMMRGVGRGSLAAEAEEIAQRINVLGAKLPLMMPDDPRYPSLGAKSNRMADDYFMREYRESMETEVQRVLGRANSRKLLDADDRIYLLHKAAERRAVEEIMRVMARIAENERTAASEERLPIRDAAIAAYEAVEATKFGAFIRDQYQESEERLEYVIRGMLIMSPPLEILAARPPSTVLRPLLWHDRSHLQPVRGKSGLRAVGGSAEGDYWNVSITRAELDRYISTARELSNVL